MGIEWWWGGVSLKTQGSTTWTKARKGCGMGQIMEVGGKHGPFKAPKVPAVLASGCAGQRPGPGRGDSQLAQPLRGPPGRGSQ